jgi:hypothetical protein
MDMNGNFLRAYRGSTLTADEILRQADASSKYAAPTAPTALSPARSTRTAATVADRRPDDRRPIDADAMTDGAVPK